MNRLPLPTYINADSWNPEWPDDCGYDDPGQRSLNTYTNLDPQQPCADIPVSLTVIEGRGTISIVEQLMTAVAMVPIDIKPGSDPNSINPGSKGVIPVAILTTEDFDATTVDPETVRFGPAGAEKAHKHAHVKDANHDGDLDLMLHFLTEDAGIAPGDTEACLTGETYDGLPIMGCDSVRTVPPK
jgi:hypothetical protein